jgi:hypothetical protein
MSLPSPAVEDVAPLLLPACLQHRAPARYEILDRWQRRVFPTLAGYRLKPGGEYQLRVETQDGNPQGWRLHIAPPPKFVDWPAADAARGNARVLSIRTRDYLRDHWLQLLDSSAVVLALKLEFDDARQPYTFEIPVVLARRWLYAPLLLGTALGGALAAAPPPWPWPWRAGLVVSAALSAAALCWLADLFRCHLRASRLVQSAASAARCACGTPERLS